MSASAATMKDADMNTAIRRGVILNGRYRIHGAIGEGGFGKIFKAVDISKHGKAVAVKTSLTKLAGDGLDELEIVGIDSTTRNKKETGKPTEAVSDFISEFWALKHLEKYPGFPKAYAHGIYQGQSYMVMELLGESLGEIFERSRHHMTLTNLLLIVDQCLERIKHIHEMGMVHGDIKPENMMMGIGENSGTLYFIDFGLASCFWDYEAQEHLEPRGFVHQGGTAHFMAVDVHNNIQQSRKDDLETFVFVLAYFLKHKKLPWQNYLYDTELLVEMKKNIKEDVLFQGYPREFAIFFNEVRNLEYSSTPDYDSYRIMFRLLGAIFGIKYETDRPCFT